MKLWIAAILVLIAVAGNFSNGQTPTGAAERPPARQTTPLIMAVAVATHPIRFRALNEVDALGVLFAIDDAILLRDVVVLGSRGIRLGIELEQLHRRRGDAVGRNPVAGERCTW